jgi:hypothetical protein
VVVCHAGHRMTLVQQDHGPPCRMVVAATMSLIPVRAQMAMFIPLVGLRVRLSRSSDAVGRGSALSVRRRQIADPAHA